MALNKQHFWPDNQQLINDKDDVSDEILLPMVKSSEVFAVITDINMATAKFISDNLSQGEKWHLLLAINPAGATRQDVLYKLEELQAKNKSLISIKVILPRMLREQILNVNLALFWKKDDKCWLNIGSTPSFGINTALEGTANLLFTPEPAVLEECKKFIDLHWKIGIPLNKKVCNIPHLIPAKGTEEAELLWNYYQDQCLSDSDDTGAELNLDKVQIADNGEVIVAKGEEKISETMKLPRIDNFEIQITEIMKKGRGATVNYKMPPLQAPLSPKLFGVEATKRVGTVTQRVQYKVDLFDEESQKKMEKHRRSVRELLNLCSYSLADGFRWVPNSASEMLDDLISRSANDASQELENLLNNDIDAFLRSKKKNIRDNCQAFYKEMTGKKEIPEEKLDLVMKTLRDRAEEAIKGDLLPKVTYIDIAFSPASKSKNEDPWGQVKSLLMDIAERPRKLIIDPYARRGLSKGLKLEDYFKAMNVINDYIITSYIHKEAGTETKADRELAVIKQLDKMNIDGKNVCQLLMNLMEGRLKQNEEKNSIERTSVLLTLGYVLLEMSQDYYEWKEEMIYHCGEEVLGDAEIIYQTVLSWPKQEMLTSNLLSLVITISRIYVKIGRPLTELKRRLEGISEDKRQSYVGVAMKIAPLFLHE